jgi:hypothetical protein
MSALVFLFMGEGLLALGGNFASPARSCDNDFARGALAAKAPNRAARFVHHIKK